jgi:hypothetical protein
MPAIAPNQRSGIVQLHMFTVRPITSPLIDPDRLDNPKYPAIEAGIRLPLVQAIQRPLAGGLHQIVGVIASAGQAQREAPQAGQQRDHLCSDILRHIHPSLIMERNRRYFIPIPQ